MSRYALVASFLLAVGLIDTTRDAQPRSDIRSAVVKVSSGPGNGSGYLLDSEHGLVATNAHVINDDSIAVHFLDGAVATALRVTVDRDNDLAIIRVNPFFTRRLSELRFAASPPTVGQAVTVLGYPLNRSLTMTRGVVATIDDDAVYVDALINPGNSGGPIVDSTGSVIATATFIEQDVSLGPGLGSGLNVNRLRVMLDSVRNHTALVAMPDTVPPVDKPAPFRLTLSQIRSAVQDNGSYWYADWDNIGVGPFRVSIATPAYNWAMWSGQDSVIGEERRRRDKKSGQSIDVYSATSQKRNWERYVGSALTPVVSIEVEPQTAERFSSVLGNAIALSVLGFNTPAVMAFKSDVFGFRLLRDGQPVKRVSGGHAPVQFWVESGWMVLRDVADFGYYTFNPEAFAPRQNKSLPRMEIEVVDRKSLKSFRTALPNATVARIWADFQMLYAESAPQRGFHTLKIYKRCSKVPGVV